MPFTYANIHPVPIFDTEADELEYAFQEAEAYFKKDALASYCMWENDGIAKYIFIAEISGGVYAVYRLAERLR